MLALVRPELPVFLHVLGAIVLFGALAATAIASARAGTSLLLRRVAFRTMVRLVLPAWLLMRLAGQWVQSREDWDEDLAWVGIGFTVADIGLVVLLIATIAAWLGLRGPNRIWPARAVTVLTVLYLVALGVAWWAMTTRPN